MPTLDMPEGDGSSSFQKFLETLEHLRVSDIDPKTWVDPQARPEYPAGFKSSDQYPSGVWVKDRMTPERQALWTSRPFPAHVDFPHELQAGWLADLGDGYQISGEPLMLLGGETPDYPRIFTGNEKEASLARLLYSMGYRGDELVTRVKNAGRMPYPDRPFGYDLYLSPTNDILRTSGYKRPAGSSFGLTGKRLSEQMWRDSEDSRALQRYQEWLPQDLLSRMIVNWRENVWHPWGESVIEKEGFEQPIVQASTTKGPPRLPSPMKLESNIQDLNPVYYPHLYRKMQGLDFTDLENPAYQLDRVLDRIPGSRRHTISRLEGFLMPHDLLEPYKHDGRVPDTRPEVPNIFKPAFKGWEPRQPYFNPDEGNFPAANYPTVRTEVESGSHPPSRMDRIFRGPLAARLGALGPALERALPTLLLALDPNRAYHPFRFPTTPVSEEEYQRNPTFNHAIQNDINHLARIFEGYREVNPLEQTPDLTEGEASYKKVHTSPNYSGMFSRF